MMCAAVLGLDGYFKVIECVNSFKKAIIIKIPILFLTDINVSKGTRPNLVPDDILAGYPQILVIG